MHTLRRAIPLALVSLALAQTVAAQASPASPDATQPPAKATLAFSASARGEQVYRCQQATGMPQWVFIEPKASLFDGPTATGKVVGNHSAGPTWRWNDGSAITGKLVATQPSPQPDAIPWLLLSASPSPGSTADGKLGNIRYVRRSETVGGVAPATGCDAGHLTAESRVPYTATYTFYR